MNVGNAPAAAPTTLVARSLDEMIRADYDELLPHLLLGDITRWLVERGPVAEVLAVLEHHIDAGDGDVQHVIAVSFLENLFGDDPGELAVRAALGPRLKAEFHAMERWTPDDPEAAT